MVFANNSAFVAFLVIIISLIVAACMLVWMWFCYYPGGYKKDQVMDIGEYSMFVAQTRIEQRKKKQQKKGGDGEYDDEDGGYDNDYDELYYEMGNKDGAAGGGNADWQSVGTSEQQEDLEGGEFYDGGASSPSTRSMSDAGATTPSSMAPSQRGGLKSALKTSSVRDDRSESTYVSTTPTSTSGGYY